MNFTNNHGISLPLAVWLLHDEYDHINDPNYISATSLLKPIRQLILGKRVPKELKEIDLADLLSSSMGTAVHDSIEKSWRIFGQQAMRILGYPDSICNNIVVNPTPEYLADNPDAVAVWFEQRKFKEITVGNKVWKIGGKFDMVIDGRLFDFKTTSVWTYMKGSKDLAYSLQGSIYRWLSPDLILDDNIHIQFIFTDWQRVEAKRNPDYPQIKAKEYPVELQTLENTEAYISERLTTIQRYWDAPQESLPECTDEELWRSDPVYKYYSDPEKAKDPSARSTKNFDDLNSAKAFQAEKGKGVVVTKLGEPKACGYCPAFAICKQKDKYFDAGI